ncbi:hypothetical protein P280DRAFT_553044 [Massarina eburnea CBS 473.64]|uniref:F-box domain-containing protein n=1 Tax=Massarina eburnea CBS 473.64 TaxID=1395130 RepID=A0A6A6RMA2_9PLEO|nr:hypothetical protein P280DRAFT_553044 [Massarina eburnea CBS 473.64]
MAAPTLAGMPLELLVHIIATYLSTKDLGALRLSSKYFETALFNTFAKEFFTKKQFMLTTPSLEVLIAISKHAALSKFVKHVIIGIETYDHPTAHIPSAAAFWAYRHGWADQTNLFNTGRDRLMLAQAFRNLPNLTTLGIRDYDATGRVRDDNNRWRSYGAPTAERETGIRFTRPSTEIASRAYQVLLQALADAEKTIPAIEVILRMRTGLNDHAFFVPLDEKLNSALNGLQQLLLTLDLKSLDVPFLIVGPKHGPEKSHFLQSFLLRTPALSHLRLNFQIHDKKGPSRVIEHLCTTNNILPNLERLDFGMMTIDPGLLLQILTKFPILRHISLWKITVGSIDSASHWRDSEGCFNPWPVILRCLSGKNPQVRGVMVGCLEVKDYSAPAYRTTANITFANNKASQEYLGDMSAWLTKAIDDLTVQWPAPPADDSASASENEGEDEDMDDIHNEDND